MSGVNNSTQSIKENNNIHNLNSDIYYNNLQEAIDDVLTISGDVIEVSNGYYDSVNINKNVTLFGLDNVSINTIYINSGGSGSAIKGFTIISSLYLDSANYCKIINNTFNNLYSESEVYLYGSYNNLFSENSMNGIDFQIFFSDYNVLVNNVDLGSLSLSSANYCNITNNTFSDSYNVSVVVLYDILIIIYFHKTIWLESIFT